MKRSRNLFKRIYKNSNKILDLNEYSILLKHAYIIECILVWQIGNI